MNKKIKMTVMGTALLATAAIPIATVASCGHSKKADLYVAVRTEELGMWSPIAEKFEELTGKKVKLIAAGDFNGNYTKWSSSRSMPDVAIADSSAQQKGASKGWFQPIDLKDVFSNSKYRIKNFNDKGDNSKIELNDKNYNKLILNTAKQENGNKYWAYNAVTGVNALYYNSKTFKKDAKNVDINTYLVSTEDSAHPNLKDSTKKVGIAKVDSKADLASYKGGKKANGKFKCSEDDIQDYLDGSVANTEGWNKPDTANGWYSLGYTGLQQRIYSVSRSCFDAEYAAIGKPEIYRLNIMEGEDVKFNNVTSSKLLDDVKVYGRNMKENADGHHLPLEHIKVDDLNSNELIKKSWLGTIGYSQKGSKSTSEDLLKVDNTQVAFGGGKVSMMAGALWMRGGIEGAMTKGNFSKKDLKAFSLPVGSPGADGYAIAKSTSGSTLDLAKKFIAFMATPEINAIIAGKKTISTNSLGQEIQIKKAKDNHDGLIEKFLTFGSTRVKNRVDKTKMATLYAGESNYRTNWAWHEYIFEKNNKTPNWGNDGKGGLAVTKNSFIKIYNDGIDTFWEKKFLENPDWNNNKNKLLVFTQSAKDNYKPSKTVDAWS